MRLVSSDLGSAISSKKIKTTFKKTTDETAAATKRSAVQEGMGALEFEVRHGRTAPSSARATAAAKEASSGLKRNRVGHTRPLGLSQGGLTDIRLKLRRLYKNPPDYGRNII